MKITTFTIGKIKIDTVKIDNVFLITGIDMLEKKDLPENYFKSRYALHKKSKKFCDMIVTNIDSRYGYKCILVKTNDILDEEELIKVISSCEMSKNILKNIKLMN